jgi:hypothetical protein
MDSFFFARFIAGQRRTRFAICAKAPPAANLFVVKR